MKVYTIKQQYSESDKGYESKLYYTIGGVKQVLRDSFLDRFHVVTVTEYELVPVRTVDRATLLKEKGNPIKTYVLRHGDIYQQYQGELVSAKEHFSKVYNVPVDEIENVEVPVIRL